MYTIAGRQIGSHWVCQLFRLAGEALQHSYFTTNWSQAVRLRL
jgi:hypothetical protein